jgi:hypothetical protein
MPRREDTHATMPVVHTYMVVSAVVKITCRCYHYYYHYGSYSNRRQHKWSIHRRAQRLKVEGASRPQTRQVQQVRPAMISSL